VEDGDEDDAPEEFEQAEADEEAGFGRVGESAAVKREVEQREEDVEVLFDRERPDDVEADRDPGVDEEDGGVVVVVEEGAEEAGPVARGGVLDEVGVGGGEGVDDVEGDDDAESAAEVEAAQRDGAGGVELAAEERGDEVSREEEEGGDAERGGDVVGDRLEGVRPEDDEEGDGADAVEAGDVERRFGGVGQVKLLKQYLMV
jgi:hypothetical protein